MADNVNPPQDSRINATSVTAYQGNPMLLDYSATKGAIVAFTRSLALSLADKGIRVNGVAPGPIWTPLILRRSTPSPSRASAPTRPLAAPDSPRSARPATSSSRRRTARTTRARCCTPTAARSSTPDATTAVGSAA